MIYPPMQPNHSGIGRQQSGELPASSARLDVVSILLDRSSHKMLEVLFIGRESPKKSKGNAFNFRMQRTDARQSRSDNISREWQITTKIFLVKFYGKSKARDDATVDRCSFYRIQERSWRMYRYVDRLDNQLLDTGYAERGRPSVIMTEFLYGGYAFTPFSIFLSCDFL